MSGYCLSLRLAAGGGGYPVLGSTWLLLLGIHGHIPLADDILLLGWKKNNATKLLLFYPFICLVILMWDHCYINEQEMQSRTCSYLKSSNALVLQSFIFCL